MARRSQKINFGISDRHMCSTQVTHGVREEREGHTHKECVAFQCTPHLACQLVELPEYFGDARHMSRDVFC